MKDFLLLLLGKEINESIDDADDGVFRSECYYDWIRLKNISGVQDESEICPEDLLVACYDEEIKQKQEAFSNGVHIQQGIIAIPADDSDNEDNYKRFLDKIKTTGIIFISFISIPSWSSKEKKEFLSSSISNVSNQVKNAILDKLDKMSMRLFHTFDHNDFAIICDGEKTKLEDYLKVLAKIRSITFSNEYYAVHDITTIYGYKSSMNSQNKINAILSISGQKVIFEDDVEKLSSFSMETIGRYDHLSVYNGITWRQLAGMSNGFHSENVITSRVHIGCCESDIEYDDYSKRLSLLFSNFKSKYKKKIKDIKFDKLVELYSGDKKYIDAIKIMLFEIGYAINSTLQRGFSKYNSVCYIESFFCFLDYIKEKIVKRFCLLSKSKKDNKQDNIKKLSEKLVDVSNFFYNSILTLDSSIMHSERRFIMSDPYHLALFDVPPKLIAYYTAVASKMADALNGGTKNRYVFLIAPDIKKDIYVESITENTDIGREINILVIHINERSIHNVTETTKIIAHEIAHHVGQDLNLRKERASYFVKCYIALLLLHSLDHKLFSDEYTIAQTIAVIEKIVDRIYRLVKRFVLNDLLDDEKMYYYMDDLQENLHSILIPRLRKIGDLDKLFYKILSRYLKPFVNKKYLKKKQISFFDVDNTDIEKNNEILKEFVYKLILTAAYDSLNEFINESNALYEGVQNIRFVFKEGYADIQMLLLTQSPQSDKEKIVENYSTSFNDIIDRIDEVMRKLAVTNAFLDITESHYDDLLELDKIQEYSLFNKAYLIYICKQAALYFSEVKNNTSRSGQVTPFNEMFDCSATSLFKSKDISKIVSSVNSIIDSYIESIL